MLLFQPLIVRRHEACRSSSPSLLRSSNGAQSVIEQLPWSSPKSSKASYQDSHESILKSPNHNPSAPKPPTSTYTASKTSHPKLKTLQTLNSGRNLGPAKKKSAINPMLEALNTWLTAKAHCWPPVGPESPGDACFPGLGHN